MLGKSSTYRPYPTIFNVISIVNVNLHVFGFTICLCLNAKKNGHCNLMCVLVCIIGGFSFVIILNSFIVSFGLFVVRGQHKNAFNWLLHYKLQLV